MQIEIDGPTWSFGAACTLFPGAGVPIPVEDVGLQSDPGRQEVDMATSSPTSAAFRRPIRVVPLRVDDSLIAPAPGAPPSPTPSLTYRGGPLLTAVQIFTFFWGTPWQAQPQAGLAQQINQFFDFVVTSPLLDQMAEYSVPGKAIDHGAHIGTATLAAPAPGPSVLDSAIQQLIQQEISTNSAVPQPTPNSLYFVFLPPGVSVSLDGGSSCTTFCGYHNDINGQIFYAVLPYPDCAGCSGALTVLDAMTVDHFARAVRSDHGPDPRPGLVRRQQRRDRRHLCLADEKARRLQRPAGMVEPSA
ncbi:MAG TPA: hypothetical protein VIO80_06690 [Candidatus Dormibacteraeota bacterium]